MGLPRITVTDDDGYDHLDQMPSYSPKFNLLEIENSQFALAVIQELLYNHINSAFESIE